MQASGDPTDTRPGRIDLAIAATWPIAMFMGVVTIVIALVVLAWPGETLTVLSVLFGIQLVLIGLFRLIAAFSDQSVAPVFIGLIGVLSMIVGVVVLRNPFETVAVLATLLGVVWIVGGSIDLVAAISDARQRQRGLVAFMSIVSIIAGVVVVAWPAPSLAVIAWVSGFYLVAYGLMACFTALSLRKLEA